VMYIDRSRNPMDLPSPPSADDIAAAFAVPLLTFVNQPALEEAGAGASSSTQNGLPMMECASISYTFWRNPQNREDPINLAELDEVTRESLETEPPWELPEWLLRARARMRYPTLWEAVRTTHFSDESAGQSAESALVEHLNYIVMNVFREERARGDFPGELFDEATEKHIQHGIAISLDGRTVPGMQIDTDPHVLGVAADLGDRILTAVFSREYLPAVRLEFVTRANPAAEGELR
jgi:hypothetical protein